MKGSFVRKRGSTWTAYYYLPGSTRKQVSKGGFRTKVDAQNYLAEKIGQLQRGDHVAPSRLTLGEYLSEHWLPLMKPQLRESTWLSYSSMVANHVVPNIGGVFLQDLTAVQLDRLYADLLRNGRVRKEGAGLAPKTVRHVHTVIHRALRDAERKQLVARNVAASADPPKSRTSGAEIRTWTGEEVATFLTAMKSHDLYTAYLLAASTGMRRGEVLGLRWRDVDLRDGRVAIRQTITNVNYELVIGEPKTKRSRRSIAIDSTTIAALTTHRQTQAELRAAMGEGFVDQDLVFCRPDGSPIHPDFFSQTFERAVKRLGLRRIRLHDLRHTHATLGLAAGVPAKVMSDRLGHSTVAFTQDTYMHAIPQLEADAADRVADLIFPTRAYERREPLTEPNGDETIPAAPGRTNGPTNAGWSSGSSQGS